MQNKSEQFKRAERLLLQVLFGYEATDDAIEIGSKLLLVLKTQSLLPVLYKKLEYEQSRLSKDTKSKLEKKQPHQAKIDTHPENSNYDESHSELSEQIEAILQSKQEKKPGRLFRKNRSHSRKDSESSYTFDTSTETSEEADADNDEEQRTRSTSLISRDKSPSWGVTRKRQFSFSRSMSKDSAASTELSTEEELSLQYTSNEESDEAERDLEEFESNQKKTLFGRRTKNEPDKKLTEKDIAATEQAEFANKELNSLDPVELSLLILFMVLIRPRLNPIFSLDVANHPINSQAAKIFCEINHTNFIEWLQKLNPTTALFQKGDGEKLFFRLKGMQQQLIKIDERQNMRAIDLMGIENRHFYKTLFEENNAAKRYQLIRELQNIAEEQYFVVSIFGVNSRVFRIFPTGHAERFFDFSGFDDPDKFRQENAATSINILDELERANTEWKLLSKLRKNITLGKISSLETLSCNLSKEILINTINYKNIKPTTVCYKPTMAFLKQVTYQPRTLKLKNYEINPHDLAIIILRYGESLVELDLSGCSGVTDKVIKIISQHCTELKLLRLDSTTVTTILHPFSSVMYLSLRDCPLITNDIFLTLPQNFPALVDCDLSGTTVSSIKTEQHFTHLTLDNCKAITNTIFDDIKIYCPRVRSLSLCSTLIYEIKLDDNTHLSSLNVSGCHSINELIIKKSALVQLKASQCLNLTVIKIYNTANLATIVAQHCPRLKKVFLAPKNFSLALSLLDFDHCITLEAIYAKPITPKVVRIENCPSLSHAPDESILQNLMKEVFLPANTKREQTRRASTLGTLSRLCYADFPQRVIRLRNYRAFSGKDLSGMDASGGNWEDLDLSGANLEQSRWVNAKISGCVFRGANLSDAKFGQYSIWQPQPDRFNPVVSSIAFSADNLLTAIGYLNNTVILRTKDKVLHTWQMADSVYALSFSPDTKTLAVAGKIQVTANENNIKTRTRSHQKMLMNLESDIMLAKVNKHISEQEVGQMQQQYEQLKAQGPYVVEDGFNHAVILLSMEKFMQDPVVYRTHTQAINQVCYNPSGQMIATCSDDGWVKIRDTQNNKLIHQYQHNNHKVSDLDWHSSGQYLVSVTMDGEILVYDTKQSQMVAATNQTTLENHATGITSVQFVPKLNYIVTNSPDKTVKLWQIHDLMCLTTWHNHKRQPSCVAVSPDGKFIASGEAANKLCKVFVWDIETGEKRQELVHPTAVTALAFETCTQRPKDGWKLFAGCANGNVHRWVIDSDSCRQGLLRNGIYRQFQADLCDMSETTGLTDEDVSLLNQMNAFVSK